MLIFDCWVPLLAGQVYKKMTEDFEIAGTTLRVDKMATERLYLPEVKITDNCNCSDCTFYADILIKQPFEIFQLLSRMGVDLGKNLSSEPTGVWCIREADGQLIHFDQVYRIFGSIVEREEIRYLRKESNYSIHAKFIPYKSDYVDIELKFDIVPDN